MGASISELPPEYIVPSEIHPHQAYIEIRKEQTPVPQICGASIIHPLLLLSSAICFPPGQLLSVQARAGVSNLSIQDGNEQVRRVVHVFVHKKFKNISFENDIAVLVLSQSLEYNNNVRQIQMPEPAWKLPG